MKRCSQCKELKPYDQFYGREGTGHGLYSLCIDCTKASNKAYYSANKDRIKAQRKARTPTEIRTVNLKSKFKISPYEYDVILEAQNHVCAICDKPETAIRNGEVKRLAVDHDHLTHEVRGLLCQKCNTALGSFGDDIATLEKAIAYLKG